MKIDDRIATIDVGKLDKDCILHSVFRIYADKKAELPLCKDKEAIRLTRQLEEYSDVLKRLLIHAKCFPASCDNCEGLTKCIECLLKNMCVNAHMRFYKLKLNEGSDFFTRQNDRPGAFNE
jgi:hypothetical protein